MPFIRRKTKSPAVDRLLFESTLTKVVMSRCIARKLILIEERYGFKKRKKTVSLAFSLWIFWNNLNPRSRGKRLQSASEIKPFERLHEREYIAFCSAPEAVIRAANR